MMITWLGHSCFKIEEKVEGRPVVILTDPYDQETTGLRLPKIRADIVTISHAHGDHANGDAVLGVEKERPLIFDRPGEYEAGGVFVQGIGAYHDKKEGAERGKSTMFRISMGGLNLLHLGDLGTELSDQQLSLIGDIDILFVPVGGKYTIDAAEAAEVTRQIEPRLVIPMHYKIPGLTLDIAGVDAFKKQMGNGASAEAKLKVNKKDLLAEETRLVILEPNP